MITGTLAAIAVKIFVLLMITGGALVSFLAWLNRRHSLEIERSYEPLYLPAEMIDAVVRVTTNLGRQTVNFTKQLGEELFPQKSNSEC